MIGWAAVLVGGPVLAVTSWWHIGGAGTGGRPFAIFLAVAVAAAFALDEWSDGAG